MYKATHCRPLHGGDVIHHIWLNLTVHMSSSMGSSVSYTGTTRQECSLTPFTHMLSDIKWTHLSLLIVVQYRAVQCEAASLTVNCVDLLRIWTFANERKAVVSEGRRSATHCPFMVEYYHIATFQNKVLIMFHTRI